MFWASFYKRKEFHTEQHQNHLHITICLLVHFLPHFVSMFEIVIIYFAAISSDITGITT